MIGYAETDFEAEERVQLWLDEDIRSLGWHRQNRSFLGAKVA